MSLFDDLWWSRVSFDVTVQSTDGNFDIVELSNLGNTDDNLTRYAGALVEFGEIELSVADETTLTANEHLGLSLLKLWGDTPSHVTHGNESGLNDVQVDQTMPTEIIAFYESATFGNNVNVFAGSGGVAVAATDPMSRAAWHGGFNVQTGLHRVWLPKDRPFVLLGIPSGYSYRQAAVWRLDQAPSSDLRLKGYLTFRTVPVEFD